MKAFFAWIRQWARTAFEAASDIAFYRRLEGRKTGEAVGYLAMFAVVWTVPLAVMFFVGLRDAVTRFAEGVRTEIPPGTVFEMKDGKLSNDLQEPLVIRGSDAVIVVNTATSTLGLQEGESGLVVGADGIEPSPDVGADRVDFARAPDFRVDREGLMGWIARWGPFLLFLASLATLVLMFLAFWAGFLLNALVHGFALWLVLKLIRRPRRWRASFVAAAYAGTAPIVLGMLFNGVEALAFVPGIVYWGFVAWIAYDA